MPSQAYVPISVWKKGVSVKLHHFCSSNIYNFSSSSSPNQLPVGLHWNIATIFFVSVPEEWDLLMVLSCSQNQSIFHNSKEHGAIDTWLCTDLTAGQRWSYTVELDTSDGGVGRWTYTHTHTHTLFLSAGLENKTATSPKKASSVLAWCFTVAGWYTVTMLN